MNGSDVHTDSGRRLGVAEPRQEAPADLRLVPPALAAWAASALALGAPGRWVAAGAVLCACAGLGCLIAVPRIVARAEPRRPADSAGQGGPADPEGQVRPAGRAGPGGHTGSAVPGARAPGSPRPAGLPRRAGARTTAVAAVLLCAAAGGAASGLHSADSRSGPVPGLAESYARVEAEVTVTSDPRRTRPRVQGDHSTPVSLLLDAEVDRLTAPDGTVTELRTPVLVMVAPGKAAARWQRLLPSTGLRITGRLAPPRHEGERIAAVLGTDADEPPQAMSEPSLLQRAAGRLRSGLREATDGLDADARALLPGLVVGDTSRVPPDLHDAFKATDLTHLLAVSGANLSILLFLLIGPPERRRAANAADWRPAWASPCA